MSKPDNILLVDRRIAPRRLRLKVRRQEQILATTSGSRRHAGVHGPGRVARQGQQAPATCTASLTPMPSCGWADGRSPAPTSPDVMYDHLDHIPDLNPLPEPEPRKCCSSPWPSSPATASRPASILCARTGTSHRRPAALRPRGPDAARPAPNRECGPGSGEQPSLPSDRSEHDRADGFPAATPAAAPRTLAADGPHSVGAIIPNAGVREAAAARQNPCRAGPPAAVARQCARAAVGAVRRDGSPTQHGDDPAHDDASAHRTRRDEALVPGCRRTSRLRTGTPKVSDDTRRGEFYQEIESALPGVPTTRLVLVPHEQAGDPASFYLDANEGDQRAVRGTGDGRRNAPLTLAPSCRS